MYKVRGTKYQVEIRGTRYGLKTNVERSMLIEELRSRIHIRTGILVLRDLGTLYLVLGTPVLISTLFP